MVKHHALDYGWELYYDHLSLQMFQIKNQGAGTGGAAVLEEAFGAEAAEDADSLVVPLCDSFILHVVLCRLR